MAEKDELLDHNYDGIQEYDNDLPRWWVNIFWLTTIFALGYLAYTHFGIAEPQHDKLARELSELEAQRAAQAAAVAPPAGASVEEALLQVAADSQAVEHGKGLFTAKCAVCHGENGQGLIGPNLTDQHWIHGGKITDIQTVVMEGVLEKGMLSWKTQLTPKEISDVVAYVWNLRGSNPPNPKAPEGTLVE